MTELFPVNVDRVAQVARRLRLDLNTFADSVTRQYQAAYDLVWKDEDPAAVVKALGTDAVKIFALSIAIGEVLKVAGITEISTDRPAGWDWSANPDGSVTLKRT
jgi:hypothetical protein